MSKIGFLLLLASTPACAAETIHLYARIKVQECGFDPALKCTLKMVLPLSPIAFELTQERDEHTKQPTNFYSGSWQKEIEQGGIHLTAAVEAHELTVAIMGLTPSKDIVASLTMTGKAISLSSSQLRVESYSHIGPLTSTMTLSPNIETGHVLGVELKIASNPKEIF